MKVNLNLGDDERMIRARYRVSRDAGHSRDCALVFALRYLSTATLRLSPSSHCCCGEQIRLMGAAAA
jgi:hypothetical protein